MSLMQTSHITRKDNEDDEDDDESVLLRLLLFFMNEFPVTKSPRPASHSTQWIQETEE
jgi:hypothetical protein